MKLRGIALTAVALMAPAFNGCSGGSNTGRSADSVSAPGQIDLQLRLPDGSTLDTLGYEITHSNGFDRDGSVNVANTALVRFQVGNIPAANGYNIALSGSTSTGVACSSEPRSFDVQAGVTTGITVTLRCGAGGTIIVGSDAGNVRVNVDVLQGTPVTCPALDGLTALPLEVSVGSPISLVGYATTSTATFAWTSAPVGTFSAAGAASTSFTPTVVGDSVVTLTVGGPDGCPTFTDTVTVTASPAAGEDASTPDASVPDAAEPPPDAAEPPPDASEQPDTSVPPPDASEPPDTSVPPPDASEPPDTSVPDTSVPDTSVPDTSVPPEDTGPPPGPTCSSCQDTACRDFQGVDLVAGCFTAVVGDFGADPADPNFIQDCTDTVQCARTNGCGFTAQFQAAECYCGANSGDACTTTGPAASAPCLTQWQRATRTTTNADVLNRFSDLAYPAGWAYFLMDCYRTSCNSAATGNCTVAGP